jgi:predicted DCC family thiol-disulfide oxidoreductase YuxK
MKDSPSARPFTVLLDGDCPLCRREGVLLAKLDRGRGRLVLEDISRPEFDPGRYGLTGEDLMARIHGVSPDGGIVEGMEVFRRAYGAVGAAWLLGWTSWPVVRPLADRAYLWFARNRLRWTGRCEAGTCAPRAQAR